MATNITIQMYDKTQTNPPTNVLRYDKTQTNLPTNVYQE